MNIIEALKNNYRLRLVYGHRWMAWNPSLASWWVVEQKLGGEPSKEIIVTDDEFEAISKLLEE